MRVGKRRIIVIGDRVLIRPDESAEKSPAGLYLPPTVREKEDVWGGVVVEVGPGLPVSDPNSVEEEPWKTETENVRYIPPQAETGDYALFLKKASVEINVEENKYLIVPQAAILVIIREELTS
ncbi:MAG TPA: co-chaperone GroES [Candidatus Marinimicrobia bacterium]|nr:co-chaperone GroES [Candidatus Neomarinimicrobiota bacterium]HIB02338.1 co-chaperone GroES [Candidatus Neomarinimicrobiota bacterium]HIB71461.1 co-chaperone GroES [Candidatus Neomarinimicrobiota bacterium]HIB96031.1 co-chaperone GroES [Candidatus Neomarinimicrobiota bacterium]HIO36970.1 co-chaperone GroES [Candidatus Neomarinimicrobiota bacterium]